MRYPIDPELLPLAQALPVTSLADPEAARAEIAALSAGMGEVDTRGLDIQEHIVPGRGGHQVATRLYRPAAANGALPALLYIHGGGFVVGSLDTEHGNCVELCRELGVALLSVDYRLAPEHPFPAGLDDCHRALAWLRDHAADLEVDPARIAVFGQSAGGGLAAALCLLDRDQAQPGPPLCFQFLGMPELDDRLDTPSMRAFTDTPLWYRANAELSWRYYLGDAYRPGAADVPLLAAPARATPGQLAGLPPAYITAMEFDPLRDEDIRYALALLEAGVSVELHTFPGTFHGSSLEPGAWISRRQNQEMLEVLRRRLGCG